MCEYKDFTPYETKEQTEEVFPLIDVGSVLFHKLTKVAEFLGDDLHSFVEMLLSKIIEEFEKDPYNNLAFWLDEKELIKKNI